LDALRDKLAKKAMEIVRMYYQTGYYEAAQIMTRNFLKTYSSSKLATEVLFILIKNNFDYARKSVDQKKYNRYQDCVDAYEALLNQYPQSNFIAEGKKVADEAKNQIKKIEERKK
jgi:outer membrane protein assembly factor BamD